MLLLLPPKLLPKLLLLLPLTERNCRRCTCGGDGGDGVRDGVGEGTKVGGDGGGAGSHS